MAAITIRNLNNDVKERLRVQAANHGRSMEAEARAILESAVEPSSRPKNLAVAFIELGREHGPIDLDLPSRKDSYERPVPFSDEWERERSDYLEDLEESEQQDPS